MATQFPLTRLILDFAAADTERLRKADPERIAKHYRLPVEWVREYLSREMQTR